MKTIQAWTLEGHFFTDDPMRVTDENADKLIKAGGFRFVPKSKWKKQVRDKKKPLDKA